MAGGLDAFFVIKKKKNKKTFYRNKASPIYLCIVHSYNDRVSCCSRGCMASIAWYICYLAFYEKVLPTTYF